MTEDDAEKLLSAEEEVVPVVQGNLSALRTMRERCLGAEIAAAILSVDDECGSKSCAPQLVLCIREQDIDKFRALSMQQFAEMVEREGTAEGLTEATEGEELPCPGCGTTAPLVAGACSDCGLVLE